MNFPSHAHIDWSPKFRVLLASYLEEVGKFRMEKGKQKYKLHESHWSRLAKEWSGLLGWTQSSSKRAPLEFLSGPASSVSRLLDADHIALWNKDGQPVAVTSQPYADRSYSSEGVSDLASFQREHSVVRHRIPYSGWHNFPRTHLDVWMCD